MQNIDENQNRIMKENTKHRKRIAKQKNKIEKSHTAS